MAFIPNTNLRLLVGIPLDKEYQHTMTFSTVTDQTNYFISKTKTGASFTDFTYQRRTQQVTVPIEYDKIYDCNYLMFQNSNFGNKWFYGFITKMEYANQSATTIEFQLDVMQTWLSDWHVHNCYVEREHTNNDAIGANIIEEGIGYGDYVTYSVVDNEDTGISDCNFVVASTRSLTDPSVEDTSGGIYDGVFSGTKYYAYSSARDLKTALSNFAEYTDSISAIFMAPKMLSPFEAGSHLVNESGAYNRGSFFGSRPLNFQGYVPRNNKLFTYPYCCMNVINNNGNGMSLRYEFFKDPTSCEITIEGVLNKGTCLICFATDYKGVVENREYQLTLAPYANCEWVNDVYATWLTQNSSSLALSGLTSVGATVGGIATGNVIMAGGGVLGVLNTLANLDKHDSIPNEIRGGQGGNYMLTGARKNKFELYNKTITSYYARVIDDFFHVYGYKTCRVKTPNIHGRKYWNYVKTSDTVITGNIPKDDLNQIIQNFKNGITFWHDDDIGNYARDNPIV